MSYTLLDYSSIGDQVSESRDAFGQGVEQKARLLNVLVAYSLLFQLPRRYLRTRRLVPTEYVPTRRIIQPVPSESD